MQCFVQLVSPHETLHSMTYLATAENVARQIAKTVAKSRTWFYFRATFGFAVANYERLYTVSCDLSRNTLRYQLHDKIAV